MSEQQPSNGASRMRKFREKQKKQDPNFAANEAKRMREHRKRKAEALSKSELKAIQLKERDKKRMQRAKKRAELQNIAESPVSTESPYKSKLALNKDVQKALKALPQSPRKRMTVVAELARIMNIAISHGQGVIDGVGGNMNRPVIEKMMSQDEEEIVVKSEKIISQDEDEIVVKSEKMMSHDEEIVVKSEKDFDVWALD